jgi:geranylgeranyl diphosphate synthase type II
MDATTRIERALSAAMSRIDVPACPPKLAAAMRYSVFPKGSRVRPRLCLAVAQACGAENPDIVDGAAAAIEFLHCASLVHDDLPCFDNSSIRRGKPSVHAMFGEPIAVLAGDALIVLAFETVALSAASEPKLLSMLLLSVAAAAGAPHGISAGQAWECESHVNLAHYHRAKTGALFIAAASAGAAAAGIDSTLWQAFGDKLGQAYQVADDIRDAIGSVEQLGKPVDQDVAFGRPSAVTTFGVSGAVDLLGQLVADAIGAIPHCAGAGDLRNLIASEARRLLPKELSRRAA